MILQVLISATDLGVPKSCETSKNATVTVKVKRNENAPVFSNEGSYRAKISETMGVNNRVTAVSAEDKDTKVGNMLKVEQDCQSKQKTQMSSGQGSHRLIESLQFVVLCLICLISRCRK